MRILLFIVFIILIVVIGYLILTICHFKKINVPELYYNNDIFPNKIPGRIIVSFSTLPSRVYYIQEVLNNLETQTLKPDLVCINLPYFSLREKKEYNIPRLASTLNVIVNRCDDYGPLTKLLPTLDRFDNPNDIIITIDDDQRYDRDFIKKIVLASQLFPNTCITYGGWNYTNMLGFIINLYSLPNTYVNILQGYKGVLYHRYFFRDELKIDKTCFTVDDIYVSFYLKKRGIPILKLRYKKGYDSPIIKTMPDSDTRLGKFNRENLIWGKCIKHLETGLNS